MKMNATSLAAEPMPEPVKVTVDKRPLYLSIGVICAAWLYTIIRNVFFLDAVKNGFDSMPERFAQALVVGLLALGAASLLLRLSKETFRDIGFRKDALLRQVGIGLLFGLLIFIGGTFVTRPVTDMLVGARSADSIDMSKLFADINTLPIWILVSVFKGGLSEELWRSFTLTRFEKLAGKIGLIAALILTTTVFGIGHLYQGVGGALSIAIIGLCNALVYLRKRSAIEAVTAHATFDLISIALGFMIYTSK